MSNLQDKNPNNNNNSLFPFLSFMSRKGSIFSSIILQIMGQVLAKSWDPELKSLPPQILVACYGVIPPHVTAYMYLLRYMYRGPRQAETRAEMRHSQWLCPQKRASRGEKGGHASLHQGWDLGQAEGHVRKIWPRRVTD